MQFLFVIVLLAAIFSADLLSAEPVADGRHRLMVTAIVIGLVMLLAQVTARITSRRLRQNDTCRTALLKRFARFKTMHLVVWAVASGAILYGLEWARLVRGNWDLAGSFLIDEALILMPVVTPLLFSWAAFYEVDRTLGQSQVAAGGTAARLPSCLRYVLTHVRHHLGLLLVPLFIVIAYQDAAVWLIPQLAGEDLPILAYLPLLAAMIVLLPCLLRLVWPTEPLPAGELRDRLTRVSQTLRVDVRDILVWKTNGMITNAAVTGFLPRLRYVFLSDGLLARFNEEHVAAIYAHELGHVRHRHLLLRVLTAILPLAAWMAFCVTFPKAMPTFDEQFSGLGLSIEAISPLLMLALMAIYAKTVMARFSRLLEHEADLAACHDVNFGGQVTEAATERFIESLVHLTYLSGQDPRRRTWLHPSVQDRIDFLRLATAEPQVEAVFRTRLRRLGRLYVMLVTAAASWWTTVALLRELS